MSITETLSSALSGLAASQAGLKAVSNNIANVNTPGYAREKANFTPMVLGGSTQGVRVGDVTRIADKFLEAASYSSAGDVGRYSTLSDFAQRLQTALGQPGDAGALSSKLDGISAAAVNMTTTGLSSVTQQSFVDAVSSGLSSLRTLSSDIGQMKTDAGTELTSTIDRINVLLKQIDGLNANIAAANVTGRAPDAYMDQRVSALDELGGLVSVRTQEQPDGRIFVDTTSGVSLVDQHARQLSYTGADASIDQTVYPPITVQFVDSSSGVTKPTGETLQTGTVGGTLGGLLDVRDNLLTNAQNQVGQIYSNLATSMNQVSNAGTALPAPNKLVGRSTGLLSSDNLNFTGITNFASVDQSGKVMSSFKLDYSTLPPGATINDAVNAINAGMGGAATASFANGQLTLQAANPANGVAIAEDPTTPGSRAGYGFSQFFGLNDIVRAGTMSPIGSGLTYSDNHGFPPGQSIDFAVRDGSGKTVASYSLSTGVGPTVGDLVTALNSSPMSSYGVFSLDPQGRLAFTPPSGTYSLDVASDGTARTGTNARLSDMLAAGSSWSADQMKTGDVRTDLMSDPTKLPTSQLDPTAAVGTAGVLSGDTRLASRMVDALTGVANTNGVGMFSVDQSITTYVGGLSLDAQRYQQTSTDANARHDDITQRRDSVSGVNVDEELAQMIVYQNSYGASAKLMTTAQSMFDELLGMVK